MSDKEVTTEEILREIIALQKIVEGLMEAIELNSKSILEIGKALKNLFGLK